MGMSLQSIWVSEAKPAFQPSAFSTRLTQPMISVRGEGDFCASGYCGSLPSMDHPFSRYDQYPAAALLEDRPSCPR